MMYIFLISFSVLSVWILYILIQPIVSCLIVDFDAFVDDGIENPTKGNNMSTIPIMPFKF